MATARKLGLACAIVGFGGVAIAQPQTSRVIELSASSCATEGGEISVRADGTTVLDWKGSFCVSAGCSTFEISDIATDGSLTLKADKSYVDGGVLSYVTTVHRGASGWEHNTPMRVDHGAILDADLRIVQSLFELSVRAVSEGKTELNCN